MFTGLTEGMAVVHSCTPAGSILKLTLDIPFFSDIKTGDSVACNGACLTVTEVKGSLCRFELMEPTWKGTLFRDYRTGTKVNVERAMVLNGRLDGHIVQGHVDCVVTVRKVMDRGGQRLISFTHESDLLVVDKGSVAVDGVSLTVTDTAQGVFTVGIIPHTLLHTTLGSLKTGQRCHVEYDVIGKYIAKITGPSLSRKGPDLEEVLKQW